MHSEAMENSNSTEKMQLPMPERGGIDSAEKVGKKRGASPHMDAGKLEHPLRTTSEGGKAKQGKKILAASFASQKPCG
jgi:hypothetical protein